jgi:hypothetical protein
VCDTQDFTKVDTRNVTTKNGTTTYHFAVIGNPCKNAKLISETFMQPSSRHGTRLGQLAPEIRCSETGELLGAALSDHGHIIIAMFFDVDKDASTNVSKPTVGRMSSAGGMLFQDEGEYGPSCSSRAQVLKSI